MECEAAGGQGQGKDDIIDHSQTCWWKEPQPLAGIFESYGIVWLVEERSKNRSRSEKVALLRLTQALQNSDLYKLNGFIFTRDENRCGMMQRRILYQKVIGIGYGGNTPPPLPP